MTGRFQFTKATPLYLIESPLKIYFYNYNNDIPTPENASEPEFDISRQQYDVNRRRKCSYRLENKYLTLFYNNKMQQMKNIAIKNISNDDNLDCKKTTEHTLQTAVNPPDSVNCGMKYVIDEAHSLAIKKKQLLQEARSIFAVIDMLNTQRHRTFLHKRKEFEEIFNN